MSIISISATKAQKDGAKYLFGTKGESILSVLESLSKAKELRSSHLNGLILMLKDAEDDELIKFKNSAGGKRTVEAAKLLATAKTLGTSLKGLRGIKVPSKWIQDHDDAKAAGAVETKTHRATGKGTKPQKAEKVANPQAPESETVGAVVDRRSKKAKVGPGKTNGKSQATLVDELSEMQPRKFSKLGIERASNYLHAAQRVLLDALPWNAIGTSQGGNAEELNVLGNKGKQLLNFYVEDDAWYVRDRIKKTTTKLGAFDISQVIDLAKAAAKIKGPA
ncbi:hypothetical protein pEaSNUABM5_00256 [Erwinia phage pEa_SNUABM_5]|uniref:Uncharacterized protein n=1 Tax=Erwinia phage pEa_SNUABM_5 TaxID=2797313 RepID=A0A7T8EPQ1_9CAUD|nr:hypothetical protein MPK73_gp256 [Erwinia phage pEa_SNUABM_5]QQO90398.1 hypothetical protein pEaSNUABM5_00256 [Erwinia phage pEa_SNUABM_5]